ncbi:MAG: PLP-dependent aspartate aminotransferase family protein [Christensenellaceae bacterium]|jgi:cystathionine gamma-synthase|nr:PLP-dependent aspartate aminotransferase family protein [Christensenellaceae bacterium]
MKLETEIVHGKNALSFEEKTGAVCVPIYQSATFKHIGLNQSTGFDYSRLSNPTRTVLEESLAQIMSAHDALCYSSGMAAVAQVAELFKQGDKIITSEDMYGGIIRLLRNITAKNGVEIVSIDTADLKAVEKLIDKNTKALLIETPTNPMMRVTDIAAAATLAHKHGALLIVDNTFLSPYFQRPLELGADIEIHSGTKYLAGHNDTLAGVVAVNSQDLSDKLRFIYKTVGACLSPFDSFLTLRGLKTLHIRMDRINENAGKITEFLRGQKKVTKVYYPGLKDHDGYAVSKKQASGFGGMISFEVDSEDTVKHVLETVKVISFAESLGGVESLITYPAVQTHADVPKDERDARGINTCLLRLSVGIENVKDLIDDLTNALA